MNYLAHAYLSFNHPEILIGNMISDFVKGKKKYDYSPEIQSGIMLHRMIDEYTDNHEVTKNAKEMFKPVYRLYAGAFIDVVYDHFLALDKLQFTNDAALKTFAMRIYSFLNVGINQTPEKFQKMFPYMRDQNWLYNYQFRWGIEKSFEGVRYRAKYITETETAYKIFNEHYLELKSYYENFFPDLKYFVQQLL